MGARYKCSCASPLTHMSFVNKLTTAKSAVDLLNDVAAQSAVSIEAERMACEAVAVRLWMVNLMVNVLIQQSVLLY